MTDLVDPSGIVQLEIQCTDVERSLAFYRDVFGWRPVPTEIHKYTVLAVPKGCSFGIALCSVAKREPSLSQLAIYLRVADINPYFERVLQCGGRVLARSIKLAGYGEAAIIADPDGQRWGLHRA